MDALAGAMLKKVTISDPSLAANDPLTPWKHSDVTISGVALPASALLEAGALTVFHAIRRPG